MLLCCKIKLCCFFLGRMLLLFHELLSFSILENKEYERMNVCVVERELTYTKRINKRWKLVLALRLYSHALLLCSSSSEYNSKIFQRLSLQHYLHSPSSSPN
ncbi:BnaA03g51120D [Brassica napus]|uniref:BnaA03g51120D protein n=1 Tax=Brassica napus TaxID=3708 RepID=A0A078FK97_BRANA|nr:BnaA03g51120D [Brassica napus]